MDETWCIGGWTGCSGMGSIDSRQATAAHVGHAACRAAMGIAILGRGSPSLKLQPPPPAQEANGCCAWKAPAAPRAAPPMAPLAHRAVRDAHMPMERDRRRGGV